MEINNRKARFNYHVLEEYVAGIQLIGSEVKSIREGNANISEAFCYIKDGEIFVKNSFISKYKDASYMNHDETRDRKLLLNKREIKSISKKTIDKGITIVPLKIFELNGKFKMKIAVVKGKKDWDKRNTIKSRDIKRDLDRFYK